MKTSGRILVCAVTGLCIGTIAKATGAHASASDAYRAIPERNVFGLKPPPTNTPPPAVEPPLPKLSLQGITTMFKDKKALIRLEEQPHPGTPAKGAQSLILGEGQREGGVMVLAINEAEGRVKVDNSGTVMDIDFDHNGVKAVPAPAQPNPTPAPHPVAVTPPQHKFPFAPRIPTLPVPPTPPRPQ